MDSKKNQAQLLQIVESLVKDYEYRVLQIRNGIHGIWLVNTQQKDYPILYLTLQNFESLKKQIVIFKKAHKIINRLTHSNGNPIILTFSQSQAVWQIDPYIMYNLNVDSLEKRQFYHTFSKLNDKMNQLEYNETSIKKLEEKLKKICNVSNLKIGGNKNKESIFQKVKNLWDDSMHYNRFIVIFCVNIWILCMMMAIFLNDVISSFLFFGAFYKMNIIAANEYWRIFTSGFLHYDIISLITHMIVFLYIANHAVKIYKQNDYFFILIFSLLLGNMVALVASKNTLILGISPAIFGLFGAILVPYLKSKSMLIYCKIPYMLVMLLLLLIQPGTSILSCISALFIGYAVGVIFIDIKSLQYLKKHICVCLIILMSTLFLYIQQIQIINPLWKKIDANYLNAIQTLRLSTYYEKLKDVYLSYYNKEDLGI